MGTHVFGYQQLARSSPTQRKSRIRTPAASSWSCSNAVCAIPVMVEAAVKHGIAAECQRF